MSEAIARRYRRFAAREAHGRSPLYEMLANHVADDPDVLAFLANLPVLKQQPNLLLAAARFVCGTPADWATFRESLLARADTIRTEMLTRRTQTNEPARCAVLLPILAAITGPLALIEVGASAGLCLFPDRYGYHYEGHAPFGPTPRFACRPIGAVPVPMAAPEVGWRAGLDLHPLNVQNDDDVAWLETLVWPGQPERVERLRAAVALARTDPPRIVTGDLLIALPDLVKQAPADATLVIFHTAVVAYVEDPVARARFAESMMALDAVWISNEAPGVFPEIGARAGTAPAADAFLLAVNGAPIAWTDPHGTWISWWG